MRLYRIKIDCCLVAFLNSSSIKLPEVVKINHNFSVIRKSVIQNLMLTSNAFILIIFEHFKDENNELNTSRYWSVSYHYQNCPFADGH